DLHHDKTQFRQGGHIPVIGNEVLGHKGTVGPGIDVLYDWIDFAGIEISGTHDDSPNIGLPVPALGGKYLGGDPSLGQEGGMVTPLQFHQGRSSPTLLQKGYWGRIHPGILVYVILVVLGKIYLVISIFHTEPGQFSGVQSNLEIMQEIGVLARVHATCREIDFPAPLVHMVHLSHHPLPFGKLSFWLSVPIVEVDMVPSVAFGSPDDLLPIRQIVTV